MLQVSVYRILEPAASGIVYQHVYPAKLFHGLVDQHLQVFQDHDIYPKRQCTTPHLAHFLGNRLTFLQRAAARDNMSAKVSQAQRHTLPQSMTCSGDDDHLVFHQPGGIFEMYDFFHVSLLDLSPAIWQKPGFGFNKPVFTYSSGITLVQVTCRLPSILVGDQGRFLCLADIHITVATWMKTASARRISGVWDAAGDCRRPEILSDIRH